MGELSKKVYLLKSLYNVSIGLRLFNSPPWFLPHLGFHRIFLFYTSSHEITPHTAQRVVVIKGTDSPTSNHPAQKFIEDVALGPGHTAGTKRSLSSRGDQQWRNEGYMMCQLGVGAMREPRAP